jgi:YidC/Oxa1 family membrane protein insertase
VSEYGKGFGWLTENWVDGHPSLGWHDTICYLSLPVILVLSQSLSMRVLTPPTQDDSPQAQQTQQIMKFLPLMIGYFSLSAPAGLGLYWFFNNVITTAQSVFIKTMMGVGPFAKPAEEADANSNKAA